MCDENCYFRTIVGRGDKSGIEVYVKHNAAEVSRKSRVKR